MTLVSTGALLDEIDRDVNVITYSTGAARNIVETRARARRITPVQALDQLDGWSNGYLKIGPKVATEPNPSPVSAHLKGLHDQDKHGNDGVGGVLDKLKLAGRIELGSGQRLTSSRKVTSNNGSAALARIEGPDGPEVRIGVVWDEDARSWRGANKGGTVKLDAAAVADLQANTAKMAENARRIRKEHRDATAKMDKAGLRFRNASDPALTTEERVIIARVDALFEGDVQDSGVLASGPWGDLVYETSTNDVEDDPVTISIRVRPADVPEDWEVNPAGDGLDYNQSTVSEFVAAVDDIAKPSGEVSAAAGADVTPGNDELHHWWTRGKGRALWVKSPEPWTTLVAQLMEHVEGLTLARAKRWASRWYIEVFGYAANSDKARVAHGKPPRGKVVGPG
jgi:hypothetical protein